MKPKKPIPFQFVLDELDSLSPLTRPMFGCIAIYLGEKIVLILRDKEGEAHDNGVWLATSLEHHASLKKEFPSMRSISIFGKGPTAWQVLPSDSPDFEEAVYRACVLVKAGDVRIGKIPAKKKRSSEGNMLSKSKRSRKKSQSIGK